MKFYLSHIILILFFACAEKKPTSSSSYISGKIKLNAPNGTRAGNAIQVFISTNNPKSQAVDLIIDNGLVIKKIKAQTNQKINLPANLIALAGLYDLRVVQKDSIVAKRQLKIKPAAISDLEIYAGPNTIIVGGKQKTMLTAIPADNYDNGIQNMEQIHYQSNAPKNISKTKSIKHLVSNYEYSSSQKSQKSLLGISKDTISSKEQSITEIADWPIAFQIELIDYHPFADNRQYSRIKTNQLIDQHGNQVADGTLVFFDLIKSSEVVARYKTLIIDGRANAYIRNPKLPGGYEISAHITGLAYSNVLNLKFQQNIKSFELSYDANINALIVGPIISVLGQFVPDGTLAKLFADGRTFQAKSELGMLSFDLEKLQIKQRNEIEVNISGYSKTMNLD